MEGFKTLAQVLIQKYPDIKAISKDDLHKLILTMIDTQKKNKAMIDLAFGMVASHANTNDPIPKSLSLQFEISKDNGRSMLFNRDVRIMWPLRMSHPIDTHFFQFLNTILHAVRNTDVLLKEMFNWAYYSMPMGLKNNLLQYIKCCSPSIYMVSHDVQCKSRIERALYQNKCVPQLLFGLNKAICVHRRHRENSDFFVNLMKLFLKNTDNNMLPKEVMFDIPNNTLPKAIILITEDSLNKMLYEAKSKFENKQICLDQVLTTMKMTEVNRMPLSCLQEEIRLIDHNYTQEHNEQLDTEHVSSNDQLHYLEANQEIAFVPLRNLLQLTNNGPTYVDFMVPTGVRLKKSSSKQCPIFPMETQLKSSMSCPSLSLKRTKDFIIRLFTSHRKLVFCKDIKPHELYHNDGGFGNNPNGFSSDNTLIGKTFLFYHCREEEDNTTSDPRKKKSKISYSLHLNKYVLQNYYMSEDLIVSNIINLLNNWSGIPQEWKEIIPVKNFLDKARNNETTTLGRVIGPQDDEDKQRNYERPITERQKNRYIQDHVSNEAFEGQQKFVNKLVDSVLHVRPEYMPDDKYKYQVTEYTLFVLALQNKHLPHRDGELLSFINPGFGVLWIKPECIKSEPIVVCRPCAYGTLSGCFENEMGVGNFTFSMTCCLFRNSVGAGSIYMPNAYVYSGYPAATDIIFVDPGKPLAYKALSKIKDMVNEPESPRNIATRIDSWWPVICPPDLDADMFKTANTPVGRLATHYSSKEDFWNNFNNPNVKDIKFTSVFTANEVFSDVFTNINTLLLYPPDVINNRYCPLRKYLIFNSKAASKVDDMEKNTNRTADQRNYKNLKTHEDTSERFFHVGENCVSKIIGSAFPITCWSNGQLYERVLSGENSFSKQVVTIDEGSFVIIGIDDFVD